MTHPFTLGEMPSPHVLRPYDPREVISISQAAALTGYSAAHVRRIAASFDLGRRIGGGRWRLSAVAVSAFLDGNAEALRAYHGGDRSNPALRPYFTACGIADPSPDTPRRLTLAEAIMRKAPRT